MKSLYNCLFICWSTAIILTLISISVPSANAGGGRRKVGGHNGLDRRGWQKLPIRPEDQSTSSRGRGRGSRKKASECRFSDKRYELEDTWHPDLGPPFGVMYCVHCECVANPKKKRIVGRVRCKNIKDECPKPTCKDPVLLPGRCCKVCSGQNDNPDLTINVDLGREEEEKNGRHYAALLSRHSSLSPTTSSSIATGRFYFRKKALTYSFVTSPGFGFPTTLTFLDGNSNIIEEFPLRPTHFQNETGKICGSWQRLPRRYRRQLRQDELYAQLTNKQGEVISGKVGKHYGLSFELFSALIGNQQNSGESSSAATAIVSVQAATGSIHAHLLMSGLLASSNSGIIDIDNIVSNVSFPLEVKFESRDEVTGETRIIVEDLSLPNIDNVSSVTNNVLTTIDFKTVFDAPELKALGEGRLSISIRLKSQPEDTRITGLLAPKFSCDLFDCVLSPFNLNAKNNNLISNGGSGAINPLPSTPNHAMRGLAWMSMHSSGLLKYQLRLEGITGTVDSIKIDNGKKSRRLLRVIDDLSSTFSLSNDIGGLGWSNGTLTMETLDIEALYRSNLYLNVLTSGSGGGQQDALRCRINSQLLNPAHELSNAPILMKSDPLLSSNENYGVTGIAWTNMDSTCRIHYSVRLGGLSDQNIESELILKDYPLRNQVTQNRRQSSKLGLQNFQGTEVNGHHDYSEKVFATQLTMSRMDEGDASLLVSHKDLSPAKSFTVEGRLSGFEVPEECVPRTPRIVMEEVPGMLSDMNDVRPEHVEMKCVYEDIVYNDGDNWKATHVNCQMCSCNRGTAKCQPILCPVTNCANPVTPPGECCPTCADTLVDSYCEYEGDGRKHPAGTTWHPYIPPWGFSKCTICTCKSDTLTVECKRKDCPQLDCPRELQVMPDEPGEACCKICKDPPPPKQEPSIVHAQRDPPQVRTDQDILNEGGCKIRGAVYENGAIWNPSVLPYGEINCVTCKCKDGQNDCSRKACPSLSCRYQVQDKNSCCARCALNKAEKKQAQKHIRLQKLRKLRRLRRIRDRKLRKKEEMLANGQSPSEPNLSNLPLN